VRAVRRAVGDDGRRQEVVRTVHGRGYQFVAELSTPPTRPDGDATTQQIGFCRANDGVRLAYALGGAGPPLVKAANWLSHLEYDWENPTWRHWWVALCRSHRLVRYDARGCGLSDWKVDRGTYTVDTWVDDLATVVDTCEVERFDLLGISQGGAVALAYAAAHPERVRRLVLYGTYLRARLARAATEDEVVEAKLQAQLARVGWGRDDPTFRRVFAMQFMPDGTFEQWEEFAELQRRTTSAENAARLLESYATIDVSTIAPQVSVPTLVLHARDDRRVPLEQGRLLAAAIPGARLVTLDSSNHILLADEPAWTRFLAEVDGFLGDPE
jgi:pimeloyl-ACP methyl ester carboxylesterase